MNGAGTVTNALETTVHTSVSRVRVLPGPPYYGPVAQLVEQEDFQKFLSLRINDMANAKETTWPRQVQTLQGKSRSHTGSGVFLNTGRRGLTEAKGRKRYWCSVNGVVGSKPAPSSPPAWRTDGKCPVDCLSKELQRRMPDGTTAHLDGLAGSTPPSHTLSGTSGTIRFRPPLSPLQERPGKCRQDYR